MLTSRIELLEKLSSDIQSYSPIVIQGEPSVSNTYFLEELCRMLQEKGAVKYCKIRNSWEVLDDLIRALCDRTVLEWKQELLSSEFIVIDDFQYLKEKTAIAEELYKIFKSANVPIIITTSIPITNENFYCEDLVAFLKQGTRVKLGGCVSVFGADNQTTSHESIGMKTWTVKPMNEDYLINVDCDKPNNDEWRDIIRDISKSISHNDFENEMETFEIRLLKEKRSEKHICYHFQKVSMTMEEALNSNISKKAFEDINYFYKYFPSIKDKYWFMVNQSSLRKISDSKCICSNCLREFPIENMDKMSRLLTRMNELEDLNAYKGAYLYDIELLNRCKELEPTWCQNGQFVEIESDPRSWNIVSDNDSWHDLYEYIKEISVIQLPDYSKLGGHNRYACNHYVGNPYVIAKYERSNDETRCIVPRSNLSGTVESLLFSNPYGIFKCRNCRKVFSLEEQQQVEHLVNYLNTPHYHDEDAFSHHDEWKVVFDFYGDEEYQSENEAYTVISTEKILGLSQGIEPVVYRKTHKRNKAEVLKKLTWNGKEWIC